MDDELLTGLPNDLPSFLARFGSDAQCGTICCGRAGRGFPLRRLRACERLQPQEAVDRGMRRLRQAAFAARGHDLRADQDRAVAWFLAIYLVTSSKGGISAMELKRQMGFGSYQTAWSWLHKIRKAMVRPERTPLALRVEADETWSAAPGRASRDAAPAARARSWGRSRAAAARPRGRRLGRLRLAVVPDVSARASRAFWPRHVARPATSRPTAGRAMAGSRPRATPTSRSTWPPAGAMRRCACRRSTSCSASPSAGCSAPTTARSGQAPARLSRRIRLPLQPPHRQEPRPPLRPRDPASSPNPARNLPHHRRCHRLLKVMES